MVSSADVGSYIVGVGGITIGAGLYKLGSAMGGVREMAEATSRRVWRIEQYLFFGRRPTADELDELSPPPAPKQPRKGHS